MLKKGELYRILYRLVENMTDRRKLYNFFKKFLGVFTDESDLINPDILPNNLGDIMDTNSNVIKAEYLPSYVDDVLEGYYVDGIFYKVRTGTPGSYAYSEPYEPETGKIYVDLNEDDSPTYRWSGSTYIVVSASCNDKIIVLKVITVGQSGTLGFNYSYADILNMINDEKHNYRFYVYDEFTTNTVKYLLPVYDIKKNTNNVYIYCTLVYDNNKLIRKDYEYSSNNRINSNGSSSNSILFHSLLTTTEDDINNIMSLKIIPTSTTLKKYIDKYRIDTSVPTTPTDTKMLSTKATLDYIDTKIRTFDKNNVVLNSQLNPFTGEGNEANVVENNKDDANNNTATVASKCHIEGSANKINNVSVGHIEGTLNTVENTGIVHVEGWNNILKGEAAIHIEGAYVNINSTGTGVRSSYINGAHIGGIHPIDRTNKEPFTSDNVVRQIGCGSEEVAKDAMIVTNQGKLYLKGIGEFDGLGEEPTTMKDVATVISDISTKTTAATEDITKIKTDITNIKSDITTIESNITTINTTLESHDTQITNNATNIANEVTRAKGEESTIKTNLSTETSERKSADSTLTTNLNKEIEDRKAADTTLGTNITTETTERKAADNNLQNAINEEITNRENAVTTEATARKEGDDALTTKITTEETRAKNAESAISTKVTAIEGKIPATASAENQLADKEFVNSSIATATATFRGTYNTLVELNAVTEGDKNDYAFYKHTDEAGNTLFDKYVYDGMDWQYQYTLNNSSFTAAQWATINSEVTKESIKTITDKVTANETAITTEHDRAVKAEQTNATAITTETNARTSADTALGTRIDNVITSVNTEKTDRETAITNLTKTVTANTTSITNLTKTVENNTNAINTEKTDRETAIANVESKIAIKETYIFSNNITTKDKFDELYNKIIANKTNHDILFIVKIDDKGSNIYEIVTYIEQADYTALNGEKYIMLRYNYRNIDSYVEYILKDSIVTKTLNQYNLTDIRDDAANGQTAYGWGNHANAGYVKETDIEPFIITLTKSGDTYTKDKSYTDINAAITDKKDIYILFTDNVLYRVNDMISTIENNGGAINLNFEKIGADIDTIVYQLAIVVINGTEAIGVKSRTQNIPTIDTSVPSSPTDLCVPSTKLMKSYVDSNKGLSTIVPGYYPNGDPNSGKFSERFNYDPDSNQYYAVTTIGDYAHIEGYGANGAFGKACHVEGINGISEGDAAHVEGNNCVVRSNYGHAEGDNSSVSGKAAHAEGYYTNANENYSHTEGNYTWANCEACHAEGKYNVGYSNGIHEVGIGVSGTKKNAHTITTDGKHYIPNIGNYTGTETDLTTVQDLATVINNYESRIAALETALANVQTQLESI